MNKQLLKEFLINGGLVTLLRQGTGNPTEGWIYPDGNDLRITYTKPKGDIFVGGEIPCNTIYGEAFNEESKRAVVDYMVEVLTLPRQDAEDVYAQVTSLPFPPSSN